MGIKNLRFSFDIPLPQLLALIATGEVPMQIDVYGNEKTPKGLKVLNGHKAPKLLAGPPKTKTRGRDKNGNPLTAYNAMLFFMTDAADHKATTAQLRPIVGDLGLHPNSAVSQLNVMRQRGHVKRLAEGTYQLTAKGVAKAAELRQTKEAAHG